MEIQVNLTEVTLLITHFNRSKSLERLLDCFIGEGYQFGNMIISDDASNQFHMKEIQNLQAKYNFQLVTSLVNKGLGNNINKGQDLVKTPLTLYVQEDFIPKPLFKTKLQDAICCMKERPDIDLVRFYAYFRHPYMKPYKNGFSEMIFKKWRGGWKNFWVYSDQPHLRRSNFLEKFGRYQEGVSTDHSERNMMITFLKKNGKALLYDNFRELFDHQNSSDEPSTVKRKSWKSSKSWIVTIIRESYFYVKFHSNYFSL